jgi:DNA-binding LacI/PurR family transcriptional regulator
VSERASPARRVTISDIAARAGVSKGAVSYALNNRPGVSDPTRARILAIAAELGWYPNRAARALSAAQADAYGFVLARPARTLALEPFYMEFISGVESRLSASSIALTFQLVESADDELAVYRRWWAERRVDGALVVDVRSNDPRIPQLVELGLPTVLVGPRGEHGLPTVWHDEAPVVHEVIRYLAALGHRRIARVAGLREFVHTRIRNDAFAEITAELEISGTVVETDFTPESGARATRRLLSHSERPTAIVFDSDLLAVTGLGVANQMGFSIPGDLSLVAWDDSLLCQVVHPPLTAVTRDIVAYGEAAAGRLLEIANGGEPGDLETPRGELTPRGSTGAAPIST